MRVSAAEAVGPAFSRMGRICFKPFNIGKWFVMGFCAFLSTCGEQQSYNFNGNSPGSGGRPTPQEIKDFISAHLGWLIVAAVGLVLLILAVYVLATWLRCRGRFMFLENVAANRAAVAAPWRRFGRQAMSYFWFCILIGVIGTAALVLIGGACVLIALPDIQAEELSGRGIAAMLLGILLMVPIGIALAVLQAYVYDFVLPIMILRDATFSPAWREAKINVFRGHVGQLSLFYLLKIVFGIGAAIIAIIATCLTCCIGGLPYLSSVLLLPILVFNRAFALSFLEQFHPDYKLMNDSPPYSPGFPVELNPPPSSPPPPPSPFA